VHCTQERFIGSKSPPKDAKSLSQTPQSYVVTFSEQLKAFLRTPADGSRSSSSGAAAEKEHGREAAVQADTRTRPAVAAEGYDSSAALTDLLAAFQNVTLA
jgi:hypothetical protein